LPCCAADISGRWKAEFRTESPTFFQFKQNGEHLTGTVTNTAGELQIQEGKVTGDDVTFAVARKVGKREVKLIYTGKVNNDVLVMEVAFPGEDSRMRVTARRQP
jgi:hypothetical protein